MQISTQEVLNVRRVARPVRSERVEAPVHSVEGLAARYGVSMEEVRRFTHRAMEADGDVARERRVRDLARRVAEGRYCIDADQVLDMAERRALADLACDL
jgi:3-methyladenine DNA glycosylase/8-oxoguanine DNA glycosylase